MKLPPKMPQRAMVRIWVASLHQELRYPMGTGVSVLSALKKGMQGWIRTAAEPTAACGGNREARLGQRSAFSKPCQGAAEKAASATRKTRRIVRREKSPCATATTAASGRNREELLGLRPAGCACRPRHDAAAGSRDPGSFSARLAQSTRAYQKTATYQNTLRFCFTILCLAVFASPACQSSWARILFCTISPAGVRARVRPSKVAYPARTQFCTKASCAVENCLPYRAL